MENMHTHGGYREGAGRPKGSTNLANTEERKSIATLARAYSDRAIQMLAYLMEHAESETARLAACNAILDRAYGKPPQAIADSDGHQLKEVTISWALPKTQLDE